MNKEITIIEAYRMGYIAGALSVEENKEDVNGSLEMVVALLEDLEKSEVEHE